jgi:hypothetical protein
LEALARIGSAVAALSILIGSGITARTSSRLHLGRVLTTCFYMFGVAVLARLEAGFARGDYWPGGVRCREAGLVVGIQDKRLERGRIRVATSFGKDTGRKDLSTRKMAVCEGDEPHPRHVTIRRDGTNLLAPPVRSRTP